MESVNRTNAGLQELFSRGSTPPQTGMYGGAQNSSSSQLSSLFQSVNESSDQLQYDGRQTPIMPGSLHDDPAVSAVSAPAQSSTERQSALLSLLGGNSSSHQRPVAQQQPTPPGSSQRSGASPQHNESQGKILLEQLMGGNANNSTRSNYSDSVGAAPSPPYAGSIRSNDGGDYRYPSHSHESSMDMSRGIPIQQQQPSQPPQQPIAQSPPKSMFDFVSPFDALSNTSPAGSAGGGNPNGNIKKKPPPPANQPSAEPIWSAPDPKRASVDNLLESLTRAPVPTNPLASPTQPSYEYLGSSAEYGSPSQPTVQPPPLKGTLSPRGSPPPPKQTQTRGGRNADSPASQIQQPTRREREGKEHSPAPVVGGQTQRHGSIRGKGGKFKGHGNASPSPHPQNIVFDVSQPLPGIQANQDCVKSTAIALVRQDSVFLPGTTIGATSWVAYAMTRGRVRVISRSSGDRTLLQLPSMFPQSSTVVDMATYRNRLAGVTSDGGFVVWELPDTITDDVPGNIMLCVIPVADENEGSTEAPLHMVKWHPKEPDTLAVASENKVYLINLSNVNVFQGQPVGQSDLHHVATVFHIPSPLIAFDFDVLHYALATIAEDSTLTLWNIHDRLPYTTHKIRGEDVPSSITFVDGGVVIGRKNGTIFQLLNMTTKSVLSTVKFVNSSAGPGGEDPDMFGHAHYDARIGTLWIANCRRESMIGFKLNFDSFMTDPSNANAGNYIEQVVEFAGPKPTIHFVILTADADPTGEEAIAACVAAKVPPGDLALVAFSVHAGGVDQILIRKEWFEQALSETMERFPGVPDVVPSNNPHNPQRGAAPQPIQAAVPVPVPVPVPVAPEDEPEPDVGARDDVGGGAAPGGDRVERGRGHEPKGKGKRNVNWKSGERDNNDNSSGGAKAGGAGNKGDNNGKDTTVISESALGQALSREIKKTEESLHTRIGRLIGKELDKQHQRLEDARAHEVQQDFARQETILKMISTELTKNTTRVVEMAVKSEVQNSVLPSLENITKREVSNALNAHVGRGMSDYISQSLPLEIEKLVLRNDVANSFIQKLSGTLAPTIDRQIRDAVNKSFMPVYSQQSSALHQEVLRELHNVKSEVTAWQAEALRSQEATIKELQLNIRALADQVRYLSNGQTPSQGGMNAGQPNLPPNLPPPPPQGGNYAPNPNQAYGPPPPPQPLPWMNIAAPQASHPASLPQPPPPPQQQDGRTPPYKPEQWDDIYLGVLQTQDPAKLRDLLGQTNADQVLTLNGPTLVSQAVILTLVHRLSAAVGELPPTDESFKSMLWWLQRCVLVLHPEDKLISDFIPRTIPTVQQWLNQAKQRLTILPNGPATFETTRVISEVQETLRRKVANVTPSL